MVALALAAPASGLTRQRADVIALQTLGTRDLPGVVTLFGEPAPLPAGRVVAAWSLKGGRARMPVVRLRSRAWLFWEDDVYGAYLAHPSRLLLVDDATGKIAARFNLDMYPLINGRAPAFAPGAPAYSSRADVVFSTVPLPNRSALAASGSDLIARAAGGRITKQQLKGQCLVTIGDRGPNASPALSSPNNLGSKFTAGNLDAMDGWAESIHLDHADAPSSFVGLKDTVYKLLTEKGCRDFMLYVIGHGRPPKPSAVDDVTLHYGQFAPQDQPAGSGEPGIQLAANKPAGSPAGAPPDVTFLTPTDISNVVTLFSEPGDLTIDGQTKTLTEEQVKNVKFKVKLDSCFSGWFAKYLLFIRNITPGKPKPGSALALVEASSSASEWSWFRLPDAVVDVNGTLVPTTNLMNPKHLSEATNANVYGLTQWANDPGTNTTLEAGIQQAFTIGASHDFARQIGYTHPQVLGPGIELGEPDPSTSGTTFITRPLPGGGGGPGGGGPGGGGPGGGGPGGGGPGVPNGGSPPPTSQFCQTAPSPGDCYAWVQGSDLYETGLVVNDQTARVDFALPSGTTVTSVSGGCTFNANDISCTSPINGYAAFDITTQQPLEPPAHATVTTYDGADGSASTFTMSLVNCSQTSCP